MKKILFLAIILFVFILKVDALEPNYTIDNVFIDAQIEDDGDMLVKEIFVLDGAFNGYKRDIYYKGDYILYDASRIDIIDVCELKIENDGTISGENAKCFDQVNSASNGDRFVYEQTSSYDHASLKMYNYNESGPKTFYIEYLLKNVVVLHNDVAELYWTFIGENFVDNLNMVKITVSLPGQAKDLRGWAHGPLNGNVDLENKEKVIATIDDLYAHELVDIRITFDKDLIPNGTKFSNKNGLNDIIKEEEQRAEEANAIRERAKMIVTGVSVVDIVWLIGLILLIIYVYIKYDKEYKSKFKLQYYREIPGEYGPEILEYLLKKNVTTISLSASILNIIRKKGFLIEEEKGKKRKKKKDYTLIKGKGRLKEKLTEGEKYIRDWLLNEYGDGQKVTIKDIKKAAKKESSARKFIKEYNEWASKVKKEAVNQNFYEDKINKKIIFSLYGILGIFIAASNFILEVYTVLLPLIIMGSILFLVYIALLTKRTVYGNDQYVKWKAFKKFLLDFGRFKEKELPEIALWEKYLVYATIFGIADKVRKEMEIKIKDMNIDTTSYPMFHYLYFNHIFMSDLSHTINTTRSMSYSKIAQTNASSGRGFGGGFSGGGGFGGGGTGGGGGGF